MSRSRSVVRFLGASAVSCLTLVAAAWLADAVGVAPDWLTVVGRVCGGGFGILAYAYLVSGGYDLVTDGDRVGAGGKRTVAGYVGFLAIGLLTVAWVANLAQAALEDEGESWALYRTVVGVALLCSVVLYLALRARYPAPALDRPSAASE